MTENQIFYGKVINVDPEGKWADFVILHFGKANENRWRPLKGAFDAFMDRIAKAKKNIPACYQHDERQLIGHWVNIEINDVDVRGRVVLDDIPFVRDVVIPQLKSGTLQGASPTVSTVQESYNQMDAVWDVIEGIFCEISLVGLPADLKADAIQMKASVQAKREEDFEIELLTL